MDNEFKMEPLSYQTLIGVTSLAVAPRSSPLATRCIQRTGSHQRASHHAAVGTSRRS
jgi:hypothetical protein